MSGPRAAKNATIWEEASMFRASTIILALGITTALGSASFAQAPVDPNGAPNPYRLDENWLKIPEGRKIGQVNGRRYRSRRQEHLGVRPLRREGLRQLPARSDREIRCVRKARHRFRQGPLQSSPRLLCRSRRQRVDDRQHRRQRQRPCRSSSSARRARCCSPSASPVSPARVPTSSTRRPTSRSPPMATSS